MEPMFGYRNIFQNETESGEDTKAMDSDDNDSLGQQGRAGDASPLGEQQLAIQVQRLWLIAATAKICHEEGPAAVTLPRIARRAGVTEEAAQRLLGTAEACLLAAFRTAASLAAEAVVPRFAPEREPVERIRVGATQLLGFCEREPQLTAVLLCRSEATKAQEQAMALALSRIVADGFEGPGLGRANLPDTRIAVEEAFGLIRVRLREQRPELLELLPSIVEALLRPQIGETAARIQAERPAPTLARRSLPGAGSPSPSLEIRLTAGLLSQPERRPPAKIPPFL
jgi:AcrR family transcriptional regulator